MEDAEEAAVAGRESGEIEVRLRNASGTRAGKASAASGRQAVQERMRFVRPLLLRALPRRSGHPV